MLPPSFRGHTVQLEALQSAGRYGPTYDPPVAVDGCWSEMGRKLTTSSTGEQMVEEGRVWLDPAAPPVSPGDRITLPNGHTGYAITVLAYDSPASLAHREVSVT